MAQRLDLQLLLEETLGTGNVYFQPPANVQMQYPCIVYHRYTAVTEFAGNKPYNFTNRYELTVIDRDPDGVARDKVAGLPMCILNRFFMAENLNHDVFHLYF